MRHAIHVPLFGTLADPRAIADIACAAEQNGWDGLFVWDHVLSPVAGEWDIADPWITLAAAATSTERIRLGPMVTPLPRRRVINLARETVTLDRLSGGRLILGLGTGRDVWREYSAFGDDGDPRRLAQVLDEGAAALTALWSGDTVTHRGAVVVDGIHITPGPVQRPRIPVWFGTNRTAGTPIERAARYDGIFPLGMDTAGIARIADTVRAVRGDLDGFDIAVAMRADTDLDRLRAAGATWAVAEFWPGDSPEKVLQVIEQGAPHHTNS
ncbi:LLM class flavin-dependent oxidoreductase [[Mycobacterium] crassicus]|uniref:LLM class flavin-dependent oxidoreductase n=1 Tax=[Mycobacterium] crassicus TaxID=2872309 RepID=A0ABU5XN37_9MYCO|nr:LLM class flavin-dependent oxidoreductase [Mycolicibacter sp. MYC098]MEB3023693.1 LLM class flavin-dependent oxidoreductase [Mycolicibacter sp. MYC098]